jgi:two-component system, cell cycle response regulator
MSTPKKKKPSSGKTALKDPDSKWTKVRHTATKTEIQTSIDPSSQDPFNKNERFDPSLIVVQGDLVGRVFRINPGRNVIGRHPSCQVQVSQRTVSSFHAELRRAQQSVIIEDLKSANGTLVNKNKIKAPLQLAAGDLIRVGNSVFKFVDKELDSSFSENLHKQMTRDPLTGAFNRGYIAKALEASIEIAKTGYPLSLIMFDLDHFKKVNDTYGHLAGDYVLKEVCRLLYESVLRAEDTLGRYGGEEFLLVLNDSNLDVAVTIAERIRATLEKHSFVFDAKQIPVTASLGVVSWTPKFESVDKFVEAVDTLLYHSKKSGRNRVSSELK